MRSIRLLILIVMMTAPLLAAIEWQTDYTKVLSLSQKEGKPMLLFFNGSDWAGSAMKMKHEVLDAKIFQEKAGDLFVYMEVDFPKYSTLDEDVAAQNTTLKSRFKIQEFPSLLILDKNERMITQIGYLSESPTQLAADLLRILEQDAELTSGLKRMDSASATQIQKLYHIAQDLGCESPLEQLLEAGLKLEDPYFYLEKYRLLVENGKMTSEKAVELRQKLMAMEPDAVRVNGQSIPFTVALIDFQELSQKTPGSEIAAGPLLEYLSLFGKKEPQNVWQIEMMIAEIYLDSGKWDEALQHAERAYKCSPETMHSEIAHSLEYIRSAQKAPR